MDGKQEDLAFAQKAVSLGWITAQQIQEWLQYCKKHPGKSLSLSDYLLKRHYLNQSQVTQIKTGLSSTSPHSSSSTSVVQSPSVSNDQVFRHYRLLAKVGEGGMGVVYKVRDCKLQRIVALKLLPTGRVSSKIVDRFLRESAAIAQLDHPNIVKVLEAGNTPQNYFVMEYIDGKSCHDLAKDELTPCWIANCMQKIANALHHAHRQKIIHRDIKPANIMITKAGEPKIVDFGLAKMDSSGDDLTVTGDILGTPKYMSPEQARGEEVDRRSDIYSLGATLYELLTGRCPFFGENQNSILQQIQQADPISPRTLNPDVSIGLEAICLKCLHKIPQKRYASAQLLEQDLKNFLDNRPISAKPLTTFSRMQKFVLCHKLPCLASALAIAIVFSAMAGYIYLSDQHQRKLQREKRNSLQAAQELFQHLAQIYQHDKKLQGDRKLLEGLKKVFRELERLGAIGELSKSDKSSIDKQVLWLYGLVYGNSDKAEEFAAALAAYDKIIAHFPKESKAYHNRGFLYDKHGDYDKAIRDYSKAIELDPDNYLAHNNRAYIYQKQKRYQQAKQGFDRAIAIKPNYTEAFNNRGNLFLARGEYRKAERDFTTALSLDISYVTAYFNRGITYVHLQLLDKAEQDYQQAVKIDPGFHWGHHNLGLLDLQRGQYREAIEHYDKAIAAKQYWQAYIQRGIAYERLEEYQQAERDYQTAREHNPKAVEIYVSLAILHSLQKQYAKALQYYDQAIAIDPRNISAYTNRGLIYEQIGKYKEAIVDWQRAIELGSPQASLLRDYIERIAKR